MTSELIKKRLNGNQLKLIAVISMLIDHIGLVIVGYGILPQVFSETAKYHQWYFIYLAMRSVGRIAFPIYAYMLVEGYIHTKDWKKYALRLGIFAILSEIPFDWMAGRQVDAAWQMQNVFFTLFLGILMMKTLDRIRWTKRVEVSSEAAVLLQFGVIGITCALAWLIKSDYDYIGILLIAIFYWFRGDPEKQCLGGFIWFAWTFRTWYYISGLVVAFALLYLYNGRRGYTRWKYGYYLFYPVHLLLLEALFRHLFGGN